MLKLGNGAVLVTVTATRSHVVGCGGLIQPTECRHGRRPVPGPAVDLRRPAPVQTGLQGGLDRFRPLFPRRDQTASFGAHAEGLLSDERRKSVERRVLRQLGGDMNQALSACSTLRRTAPGPTGHPGPLAGPRRPCPRMMTLGGIAAMTSRCSAIHTVF